MESKGIASRAATVVEKLGGKENLAQVNHCATRLRLTVKNPAKVDVNGLKKIPGVLGVEQADDNFQVIVGQTVEDLYNEVGKLVGSLNSDDAPVKSGKKSILNYFSAFLLMMAGIMSPLIPALVTAGFLSTLLVILQMTHIMVQGTSTYTILNNFAQSVFYFLPVFVAYTAAKKFNTDPVLAIFLASALLYPGWVTMAAKGGFTSYFGIPVMLTTYNGAVIQIILSVFVMAQVDKLLKKIIPEVVRHFLKPFVLILIMSVITLSLTGPLGGLVTNYIAAGISWIQSHASWLTVPALVAFSSTIGQLIAGFHLALIPIATQSLATVGYDDIINIWFFCGTITPGFIALAVTLKTKNNNCRQVSIPACLSALFGGISEPTLYGIEYKMVKPFYAYVITAISTSVLAGIMHLKCYAFGGYSLTNILLYLGPKMDYANFRNAIICVIFMAVMAFITTYALGFDDSVYNDSDDTTTVKDVKVVAPVKGTYIAQADIADKIFAKGVLGTCFGIQPENSTIVAPVSGNITMVADTNHAIGITTDDGAQIMVHIGIDSVKLNGEGLQVFVKVGDKVKVSDPIAKYDKSIFEKSGIDDIVVCILMNSEDYKLVMSTPSEPLVATV